VRQLKPTICLIILAAFTLRLLPVRWHSFHPDEALYSWWALQIASGDDPFLLSAWVDKPPVFLYILALAFKLFGISEFSARFPGIFAGTLSVVLVWAWLRSAYGEKIALVGVSLLSFLPLPVLFSPTALTDPWLCLFIVASLWMAYSEGRPSLKAFLAGFSAGLAVGTKQQGLLFAPFSLLLTSQRKKVGLPRFFWLLGFLVPFAVVEWWDVLRWAGRPSFWERSLVTYGGLGLVHWPELGPRLLKWLELLSWTAGGPIPASILTVFFLLALRRKSYPAPPDQAPLWFLAFWFTVHWLLNIQPWDRYILMVVPFLVAIWAYGLAGVGSQKWKLVATVAILASGLLALRPDGLPAGSNYGLYDGVEELMHYLQVEAKPGAIIYHSHLGWHLNFYLYSLPVEARWYPSPAELLKDLRLRSAGDKLIAFAPFEDDEPVLQALRLNGYCAEKLAEFPHPPRGTFRVYGIENCSLISPCVGLKRAGGVSQSCKSP
jgi:4-amino-4-deoxy-L-arabinose transferase-like glycosyltransferase